MDVGQSDFTHPPPSVKYVIGSPRAISATTEIPVNVRGPIAAPDMVLSPRRKPWTRRRVSWERLFDHEVAERSPMLYVRDTSDMRDALYY